MFQHRILHSFSTDDNSAKNFNFSETCLPKYSFYTIIVGSKDSGRHIAAVHQK